MFLLTRCLKVRVTHRSPVDGFFGCNAPRVVVVCVPGKGDNKLGKLLERVRADALAGKDTDVWCSMRFQLPGPLDVAVDLAVTKAGQVVAEPSFEGKPVIRMGEISHGRCLRQSVVWCGVSWVGFCVLILRFDLAVAIRGMVLYDSGGKGYHSYYRSLK